MNSHKKWFMVLGTKKKLHWKIIVLHRFRLLLQKCQLLKIHIANIYNMDPLFYNRSNKKYLNLDSWYQYSIINNIAVSTK